MAQATLSRPAPQPQQKPPTGRSVRLLPDTDGQGMQLAITQKGITTRYWLNTLDHPEGHPAYRLEKQGDGTSENEVYDVVLHRNLSECTCADFVYRGWVKGACKHILACHALKQHGRI